MRELSNTVVRGGVYTKLVLLGEKEYLKDYSSRSARMFVMRFEGATSAEKIRANARLKEIIETGQAGLGWRRRLRDLGLPF